MITSEHHHNLLRNFASALVDQKKARILVEAQKPETGYWFGGGNVIEDADGSLLICGRYRNYGDSRTGVGAGERGLELAVFRASSPDSEPEKILSYSKADLSHNGADVVSIEGSALHRFEGGIELFVSLEKDVPYPKRIADFQKPGTGVWSIDRIAAEKIEDLDPAQSKEVIPHQSDDIARLHCKDPWVSDLSSGDLMLGYCTHPFSWSSSGTGIKIRNSGQDSYEDLSNDALRRGPVWDIAAARITERLPVPKVGAFADLPDLSLYFYDSAECLRQLDENPAAVSRPRGWSCEEIGAVALGADEALPSIQSICDEEPLFISPHGTGCSRYVATAVTGDGIFANWQQSQSDLSQPLVGHFLSNTEIETILS